MNPTRFQGEWSIKRLKVATIVGTRPEIIRLARVISTLRRDCEHSLIHTGQNYDFELNEIFFRDLKLDPPNHYLNAARDTPMQTVAAVIKHADVLLRKLRPDAVLVLGDTNSGLSLLAAKRLGIPTFHMEAGNRCFDMRVPEEINRRIIDHVADINLPYSQLARENLLREGLPPDQVIVTGSPLAEVLTYYRDAINSSKILETLNLQPNSFFVVSLHREENVDEEPILKRFVDLLNQMSQAFELPIIVSTHPRTRKRLDGAGVSFAKEIRLLSPLSFTDYVRLQENSKTVLSDSGTINEESAMLGLRAINLREAHERPEASEQASTIMTGANAERVLQAIAILANQGGDPYSRHETPLDYQSVTVAEKVSRTIHSYVDFVRRRNSK